VKSLSPHARIAARSCGAGSGTKSRRAKRAPASAPSMIVKIGESSVYFYADACSRTTFSFHSGTGALSQCDFV
jgi:hypothetical protein